MGQGRCVAVKLVKENIQGEGLAVILKTGEGTGTTKQVTHRWAVRSCTLVNNQLVDAKVLCPSIVTNEDNDDVHFWLWIRRR